MSLNPQSLALGRWLHCKVDEMLRFNLLQRRGLGLSGELAEVSNHVRMIVILGGMGDLRPVQGTLCSEAESMTKARDAGQGLRGHTCVVEGSSLKLAKADAHLSGYLDNFQTCLWCHELMKRSL